MGNDVNWVHVLYTVWLASGSQWTCDGKNSPEFECATTVMHGSSSWMLERKRGSSGTTPAIARDGRVMDVTERQGAVASTSWAPVRASSCASKTQRKATSGFLHSFRFGEKRVRCSACFGREKEHAGWMLVPTWPERCGGEQRRSEDAVTRRRLTFGVSRHLDWSEVEDN
jgi:hypothetical protein